MDQSVYAAQQSNKYAEICNRFDLTLNLVALLMINGEVFPRIRLALLHPEGDTTTFLINLKDHHLDLIS